MLSNMAQEEEEEAFQNVYTISCPGHLFGCPWWWWWPHTTLRKTIVGSCSSVWFYKRNFYYYCDTHHHLQLISYCSFLPSHCVTETIISPFFFLAEKYQKDVGRRWRWRKKVVVVHCSALLSRLVISDKETHTQSPGELHYALPSYININSLQYYYYKRQQEEPLLGDKCCR